MGKEQVTVTLDKQILAIVDKIMKSGETNRSTVINAILEETLIRKPLLFKALLEQSGGTGGVFAGFYEEGEK